MLKKVLEYAGDYRKKTYQAIATMLIGELVIIKEVINYDLINVTNPCYRRKISSQY